MDNNWMDQLLPKVPGILGSAGALMWIQGSWPRKVAMLFLGVAASAYGTADFVALAGISEGLAGFVVGLFSMTAADWCFRAWDQFALGPLLNEWVRKRLGLGPQQKDEGGEA
ncbi:hypothetical protein IB233_02275 [Comamonas sp. CMM01]|uniref:hypothetical protein n=1 Tax=Comamonas sp. CMM01 TaxID=2769280 RepID=UPI00177C05A7|nr:hypothetical protein [Comamonas sp. CMM01]MBD9530459.1 hypothetical protein [Comamonas sp. CMM01]